MAPERKELFPTYADILPYVIDIMQEKEMLAEVTTQILEESKDNSSID